MKKKLTIYNGKNTLSSISDVEKTGQVYSKESQQTTFLHHIIKVNSKYIKDLNVKSETIILLKEKIGNMLLDIHLSNFLDLSPQARETKAKIN